VFHGPVSAFDPKLNSIQRPTKTATQTINATPQLNDIHSAKTVRSLALAKPTNNDRPHFNLTGHG